MPVPTTVRLVLLAVAGSLLLAGCELVSDLLCDGDGDDAADRFPDVLAVELRPVGEREFDVAVTISSPYDTPERYADGWRVLGADGDVLGTHTLLHDHASEQPFTRTQRGLRIPPGTEMVTVEGRDLVHGYGGGTVTVPVPE